MLSKFFFHAIIPSHIDLKPYSPLAPPPQDRRYARWGFGALASRETTAVVAARWLPSGCAGGKARSWTYGRRIESYNKYTINFIFFFGNIIPWAVFTHGSHHPLATPQPPLPSPWVAIVTGGGAGRDWCGVLSVTSLRVSIATDRRHIVAGSTHDGAVQGDDRWTGRGCGSARWVRVNAIVVDAAAAAPPLPYHAAAAPHKPFDAAGTHCPSYFSSPGDDFNFSTTPLPYTLFFFPGTLLFRLPLTFSIYIIFLALLRV